MVEIESQKGFTYISVLLLVIITGIMAAQGAKVWKTAMQREREAELIFRGTQIRDAMRRWYKLKPGADGLIVRPGMSSIPPTAIPEGTQSFTELKDLLLDPRSTEKRRYLRRLYLDPVTGKEWRWIKDASQRIIGVASTSEAEPIKKGNFPFDLDPADFEGKNKYSEWEFICTHWPKPVSTKGGIAGADLPSR